MAKQYFNTPGVNTYINPLLQDGALIHAVNVESFPFGAKTKRSGYSTFLGTPDNSQVNSLFSYYSNNGTTFKLLRASGSIVYHSIQGTGAWTTSGNGTISNGSSIGYATLDETMVIGDGVGSTRHTTSGTSFTNTTLAPVASEFEQYQNRIYAMGTASDLFYSTTNDATNWNTSGTSDSSSFKVPGAGKLLKIFKSADKLLATKNSGEMFKWDGFSLIDMATKYGPSSPYSVGNIEDIRFYINRFGNFSYAGGKPQIISNAVQRQFYNDKDTGIIGTAFNSIPAVCHRYDYLASVGTITDDFTSRAIPNAIIKYDYQKNEYLNWSFANKPTAWHSYVDTNGDQQLIFGDSSGQVYKLDTTTTDNGQAIEAEMVFIHTYDAPEYEKKWNWWRGIFNPGCQAKVQVACSNTYTYSTLRWFDLGDCSDGVCEFRFPPGSQSRLLFVRIYESSKNAKFTFYGSSLDAEIEIKR